MYLYIIALDVWCRTPVFIVNFAIDDDVLEYLWLLLQLKVKDVHLRYEDDVTIPGTSFACGITIKSLSAQSTDSSWVCISV